MVTANEEVAWGYNKQRQCRLVQEAALLAIESVDAPKSKIQKKKTHQCHTSHPHGYQSVVMVSIG